MCRFETRKCCWFMLLPKCCKNTCIGLKCSLKLQIRCKWGGRWWLVRRLGDFCFRHSIVTHCNALQRRGRSGWRATSWRLPPPSVSSSRFSLQSMREERSMCNACALCNTCVIWNAQHWSGCGPPEDLRESEVELGKEQRRTNSTLRWKE